MSDSTATPPVLHPASRMRVTWSRQPFLRIQGRLEPMLTALRLRAQLSPAARPCPLPPFQELTHVSLGRAWAAASGEPEAHRALAQ